MSTSFEAVAPDLADVVSWISNAVARTADCVSVQVAIGRRRRSMRNALNQRYPELVAAHIYSPRQLRTLNGGVTVAV